MLIYNQKDEMSNIRLYLTADIHLMASLNSGIEELKDDSYAAYIQFVDKVCEDAAKFPGIPKAVIHGGDTGDTNYLNKKAIEVLLYAERRFKERNIAFYSVEGNHDLDHSSAGLTYIQDISDKIITIGDKRIAGIGYTATPILLNKLAQLKGDIDLLITHTALKHLFSYHDASALSLEDLANYPNIKNVFAGHIHITDFSKMANKGYCVSPGSLHPTSIKDAQKNGFVIWDLQTAPAFEKLECRPCYEFIVRTKEELDNLKLPEADFYSDIKPYIKIKFLRELGVDIKLMVAEHPDLLFKQELISENNIEDEEETRELLEKLKEDKDNANMLEVYTSCVKEKKTEEFNNLMDVLLNDPDSLDKFIDNLKEELINADSEINKTD
jgi:DNA repair exonuclease SbcCD nuclease subunit